MSDYDPGDLYDPPPRRRREYGQEDEYDDAFAAGDGESLDHPGISSEDRDYGIRRRVPDQDASAPDLGPLPPHIARRRRLNRPALPSPRTGSYEEWQAAKPKRKEKQKNIPGPYPPRAFHLPFWQILLLVTLVVLALLACTLALAAVLSL